MTSIITDIGMVIQAMRDDAFVNAYDPTSAVTPFFFNGRRKEVVNKVADLEKMNAVNVFPLIALNGDYQYTRRGSLVDYKLNLLIAVGTSGDLSTEEREEKNYIPTLYPIYEKFIEYFGKIGLFMWDASTDLLVPPHQPVNRYYYGTNDSDGNIKNMFDEPVDAIELVNFEFTRDLNGELINTVVGGHYSEPPYEKQYE